MRDLNHDFKRLCQRNRDGSLATQHDRENILSLVASRATSQTFEGQREVREEPGETVEGAGRHCRCTAGHSEVTTEAGPTATVIGHVQHQAVPLVWCAGSP
jgi:hypothetical protein